MHLKHAFAIATCPAVARRDVIVTIIIDFAACPTVTIVVVTRCHCWLSYLVVVVSCCAVARRVVVVAIIVDLAALPRSPLCTARIQKAVYLLPGGYVS